MPRASGACRKVVAGREKKKKKNDKERQRGEGLSVIDRYRGEGVGGGVGDSLLSKVVKSVVVAKVCNKINQGRGSHCFRLRSIRSVKALGPKDTL